MPESGIRGEVSEKSASSLKKDVLDIVKSKFLIGKPPVGLPKLNLLYGEVCKNLFSSNETVFRVYFGMMWVPSTAFGKMGILLASSTLFKLTLHKSAVVGGWFHDVRRF